MNNLDYSAGDATVWLFIGIVLMLFAAAAHVQRSWYYRRAKRNLPVD